MYSVFSKPADGVNILKLISCKDLKNLWDLNAMIISPVYSSQQILCLVDKFLETGRVQDRNRFDPSHFLLSYFWDFLLFNILSQKINLEVNLADWFLYIPVFKGTKKFKQLRLFWA